MRRFRFSIAGLLGVVPCVAVAVAALRAADDAWDSGLFGLILLVLATAVLLAVHRTGRRRAYWLGFALFGGVYLGASLVPPVAARLPSTKGLAYLDAKVPGRSATMLYSYVVALNNAPNPPAISAAPPPISQVTPVPPPGNVVLSPQQGGTAKPWAFPAVRVMAGPSGSTENFVRIGHSLLSLVLAFVGGHLSRYLHAGRSGPATMPRVDEFE